MPQGQPVSVPDDGLTTRQRRARPLLVVHTGDGKGKSTAAFGLMLRAWAAGWPVGVFQFVKSAKWRVGEQSAAEALSPLAAGGGAPAGIDWHKMGEGWSWTQRHIDDSADAAREGWRRVQEQLAQERYRLWVLDEFTYPMQWGWVDTDEVVATLRNRPGTQHVVVTGRRAPQQLLDAADLVTEMVKVKHPMDVGQKGQQGIEW